MDMTFFQFPWLPGIGCVFTGRGAGPFGGNLSFNADADSARQARAELLRRLAPQGLKALAECRQVHGTGILVDPLPAGAQAECMSIEKADAMLTARPGLGLMVKTADCQPLLLTDGRRVMAAHVGWRGNRSNFPGIAAKFFADCCQVPPASLWAVRGPSLGHAEFVNAASEWDESFLAWHDAATNTMDLWQMTRSQLMRAGLPQNHIYSLDMDTWANSGAFFSWRRHKTPARQAGIIWIREM